MQDQSQLTAADITNMSDNRLREEKLFAAIATTNMREDGLEAQARERAEVFRALDAESRRRRG